MLLIHLQILLAHHPAVVSTLADELPNVCICHAAILWIVKLLLLVPQLDDETFDLFYG